jgi:hypothetical protein
MGVGWRLWRLSWLIAWLLWWQFVASLVWVVHALVLSVQTVTSVRNISFVKLLTCPFGVFLEDVRRIFMQRLPDVRVTLGFLSPRRFAGGQC